MTLFDMGALAVGEENPSTEEVTLVAGFDEPASAEEVLSVLQRTQPGARLDHISSATTDAWSASRREWLRPIETAHWRIVPPWLTDTSSKTVTELVIDPGSAFGDAGHPTTRLMLDLLPDRVKRGAYVLDLGTGTGVLAVAAASLGAQVRALDIDPHAVAVAQANVVLNTCDTVVTVDLADASQHLEGHFDLAMVNVTVDIHREVSERLRDVASIITSGILEHQLVELEQLYAPRSIAAVSREQDWLAVHFA